MARRRAISHVVAALLVALMVVGIALGLYAYFNGWFASKTGNLQTSENLLVIQSAYYNETGPEVDIYVANLGENPATIAYVTIADAATGKIKADYTPSTTVAANSVGKIAVPVTLAPGLYVVKVLGSGTDATLLAVGGPWFTAWLLGFDTGGDDFFSSTAKSGGWIYAAGARYDNVSATYQPLLVKLSAGSVDVEWVVLYPVPVTDVPRVAALPGAAVLAAPAGSEVFIAVVDAATGSVSSAWMLGFGAAANVYDVDVATLDGTIYVAATTDVGTVVAAVDPAGSVVWAEVVTASSLAAGISVGPDGYIYVAAGSYVAKLDPATGAVVSAAFLGSIGARCVAAGETAVYVCAGLDTLAALTPGLDSVIWAASIANFTPVDVTGWGVFYGDYVSANLSGAGIVYVEDDMVLATVVLNTTALGVKAGSIYLDALAGPAYYSVPPGRVCTLRWLYDSNLSDIPVLPMELYFVVEPLTLSPATLTPTALPATLTNVPVTPLPLGYTLHVAAC